MFVKSGGVGSLGGHDVERLLVPEVGAKGGSELAKSCMKRRASDLVSLKWRAFRSCDGTLSGPTAFRRGATGASHVICFDCA